MFGVQLAKILTRCPNRVSEEGGIIASGNIIKLGMSRDMLLQDNYEI